MLINQNGRSMIEMLGVLSIIGVLSVGGLTIVGKARRQQEITKTLSEVSEIVESSRKLSCQYNKAYGDYVKMLKLSDAYPSDIDVSCTNSNCKFILTSGAEVNIPYVKGSTTSGEKSLPHFIVSISGMDDDMCVNLATTDWGRKEGNGYIGASFKNKEDIEGMQGNYPLMDPGTAALNCSDSATLFLGFRGCNCTTCNE